MSKRLLIMAAILLLSVPAFAAVENIKVSGDINEQFVLRDMSLGGVTGGERYIPMDAESYLLSQVRLRFDADLTENVSGVIRIIDERMWGSNHDYDWADNGYETSYDDIGIDLAYIELKEFLYQPLSVTVGRQNLRYGSGLIVADPDTNMMTAVNNNETPFGDLSLKKSFDAAKVVLDFAPWTIDAIYSKVNGNHTYIHDNTNLWGVNANYQWGSFDGVTEAYYFGAQNNRDGLLYSKVNTQIPENQDITHVIGARTQFNPMEKLTLGLEGAYQFGDVQDLTAQTYTALDTPAQHLRAFAIEAMAEYRFMTKYNPTLGLTYVYLSGEDDLDKNHFTGWDPMFEDQSLGEIANILFPNSNIQGARVNGSIMPREDITLGASYSFLKLANNINYTAGANTYEIPLGWYGGVTYDVNTNDTYLGSEVDAYATYDYTEDVQLKLTGAWFIPGDFFADTNDDLAYSVRGGINLNF
ncbi:MAG: alginate export family protein [Candidatus Omnitrophica bacterium]|nr:alginate export family protein [Candidatus Omnitrophota bacterium]